MAPTPSSRPDNASRPDTASRPPTHASETASVQSASTADNNSTVLQQLGLEDQELAEDDSVPVPPPAYGDLYGEIHDTKYGTGTSAQLSDDGRVTIRINHFNRHLSQIFLPTLGQDQDDQEIDGGRPLPPPYIPPSLGGDLSVRPPPPLNIVMQVVGSRGDVQPFIALGKVLKEVYHHRVRLATHPIFKDLVEQHGLEFFSIGGDPTRLMAFMVKNPGLRPHFRSIMSGDVGQQRRHVAEFVQGCWRSCYRAGDGMEDAEPEDTSEPLNPFVADCIIANPPSFAHIHCAEKLGIPLHIMFTMPYSPTHAFPHPLANVQATNADPQLTNYISYALIELLSWQALGDIINRFRVKCLGLDPVSSIWAPGMLQRLRIPHSYCWSPALIPKPADWGSQISVDGFYFLDTAANYTPTRDLQDFLDAGPPPVYIGFGSIVLNDPDKLTEIVLAAAKKTGQRILLSKGWGGIGAEEMNIPDSVFLLGNVPHDWLFKHVSCVVHHGGAGTTAAGIAAGRPTTVVPFFGDQPFWGAMIARAGAGPAPIPHKQLTADNLAKAIKFCLSPTCQERAQELASKIAGERGCDTGAQSFHQFLDYDRLRCTLAPSRPAVWRLKHSDTRLSAFAAWTLVKADLLDFSDLKLFRPEEHYTDEGPWDPISGGFTAFVRAVGGMTVGMMDVPGETWRAVQLPRRPSQASESTAASRSEGSHPVAEGSNAATGTDGANGTNGTNGTNGRTGSGQSSQSLMEGEVSTPDPSSSLGRSTSLRQDDDPGEGSSRSSPPSSLKRYKSENGKQRDILRPTGVHVTKGAGRFARAVVQGPVDISSNLAKGLHNMPRLWGDTTVRRQEKVTDFKSGVKAVGKEFGYGWYDGITGLVTQPWRGAQKDGAVGLVKGVGKGVGGFLAKPSAALFGILGHSMQGMNKEVQKWFGNDVESYIIASRMTQGHDEWLLASEMERRDVIARWKRDQKDLKKKGKSKAKAKDKGKHETPNGTSTASGQTASAAASSRETEAESVAVTGTERGVGVGTDTVRTMTSIPSISSVYTTDDPIPVRTTPPTPPTAHSLSSRDATSYSNHLLPGEYAGYRETAEATSSRSPARQETDAGIQLQQQELRDEKTPQEKTEEQVVLEYVKKQSLLESRYQKKGKGREAATTVDHQHDDDDDEEFQRALKLSQQNHENDEDDEDFQRALKLSQQNNANNEDDEELQKALKLSMHDTGQWRR